MCSVRKSCWFEVVLCNDTIQKHRYEFARVILLTWIVFQYVVLMFQALGCLLSRWFDEAEDGRLAGIARQRRRQRQTTATHGRHKKWAYWAARSILVGTAAGATPRYRVCLYIWLQNSLLNLFLSCFCCCFWLVFHSQKILLFLWYGLQCLLIVMMIIWTCDIALICSSTKYRGK